MDDLVISLKYIVFSCLPDKYITIMKAFFSHTISAVRVNGELTDWFTVNSGAGQVDIQVKDMLSRCGIRTDKLEP